MAQDFIPFVDWAKNLGLSAVCVILAWLLWKCLLKIFSMYEGREARLEKRLELAEKARDAAIEQVNAEKDRYHRLAENITPVIKEMVGWHEYLARVHAGQGGNRTPTAVERNRAVVEEDEGSVRTPRRRG